MGDLGVRVGVAMLGDDPGRTRRTPSIEPALIVVLSIACAVLAVIDLVQVLLAAPGS